MARTVLPLQGTPTSVFDARNPTLVPNFDRSTANAYTIDHSSPNIFLSNNARSDATATVTITGSANSTDTVTLTFTLGTTGVIITETYTVGGSDTLALIAAGLTDLINSDQIAASYGLYATVDGASDVLITVRWNGPVGNTAVVAFSSNAANTTATLSPVSGALSGGTGPIFPTNNFNWSMGGGTTAFFYGTPAIVGYDVMLAMVNQQMSIV